MGSQTEIEGKIDARDLINALVDAGIIGVEQESALIAEHGGKLIKLDVKVPGDELVEHAATSVLLDELEGRDDFAPYPEFDPHNIAEGCGISRPVTARLLRQCSLARWGGRYGADLGSASPMSEADPYIAFLEAKVAAAPKLGLPCDLAEVQTHRQDGQPVRDHQRAVVRWGVQGGRRAYFLNFGLGKSTIQVETGRIVLEKVRDMMRAAAEGNSDPAKGPVWGIDWASDAMPIGLIVGPLGCRSDLIADAAQIGVTVRFVRDMEQVWAGYAEGVRMFLTNFETVRDGKIEVSAFTFASIDEAAALRDYGSETFQTFLPLFEPVPYRFVATAMPAPNRYKELIHYAAFLGIMDSGQALTRFFQRNSEKAGDLTLYPHKEDEFWLWVNSWAVFLQKPSDLGFSDDGYDLPDLIFRTHMVHANLGDAGEDRDGQARLLKTGARGVVETAREARDTIDARVAKVAEIVAESPDDHFILWHDLEAERTALRAAVPGIVEVFGTQKLDVNERLADEFAAGKHRRLAAKPSMLGAGRNFQYHCHRATIFPTYKFHDFLQALMRIWRFMQQHEVTIDLIYAETQAEQLRELMRKWDDHKAMVERMSDLIRRYGLNHDIAADQLGRTMGIARTVESGESWTAINNDCIDETRRMADNSVDLIVTSIPFGNHYEYSAQYEDFGHTDDSDHFFRQMDFLTPELLRVLKPGRVACIHVKDRIRFAAVTGLTRPTVDPFHAQTIEHFRRHGFAYAGLRFIATDVVRENNQTYRLTYKELKKDSSKVGCGSPEYLLEFFKLPTDRSKGYADIPVFKLEEEYSLARWQVDADSLWRSSGDRLARPDELGMLPPGTLAKAFPAWSVQDVYDHEQHVAIGEALAARNELPRTFAVLQPATMRPDCWTDVARMQTLNGEQTRRGLENHICPLQFDIVDRAIRLKSNPGELVYDPFGGLMTVPVRAMKLGRRGIGCELNSAYFADGVRYCRETEAERSDPSLFDLLGLEGSGVTAQTLAVAVATAVAAILADRVEIAPDAILPLLPDHIRSAGPSKKSINKAVAAAGWRRVPLREGGTVFRAPQAASDPMARRGEAGDNISAEQLRLLIERIERLEEEKKGIADDIKDVYAEGKSTGFDIKTMRAIVKLRKMEKHHRDEAEALLELYKEVFGL